MPQESTHQNSIWEFSQHLIYIFVFLDIYVQLFSAKWDSNGFLAPFNKALYSWPLISNPIYAHALVLVLIIILGALTKARKDIDYNINTNFWYWLLPGFLLFILSIIFLPVLGGTSKTIVYISFYIAGALLLNVAISNLSKRIHAGLKKDLWNSEEESFQQNNKLVETEYSVNLPIKYNYNKKVNNGWININPFRGMLIIGVPGSGKTESVIIPMIKQLLSKGFSMLIYDFKFPDLAKIAYHHYKLNKTKTKTLKNHQFHLVYTEDVEKSRRVNPLAAKYIRTLADAIETAEAIIYSLQKTDKTQGTQQFFTQSAINFLSSIIYHISKAEGGKYSTLPHVIAALNLPYDKIFNKLFQDPELVSLLSPFKTAYDNEAYDQLEGQIGTLKINIARLATKETFWIFSANDFDLKFSNPPSVVILGNSPQTQNINSAFYSALISRMTRLINSKGNTPSAIIIDESPTIYLHKIENLVATARSNKVAVALGLQELPQLQAQYGKDLSNTITSIMGSVLSGAVRNRETLDWLEKLFGKIKQTQNSVSINRQDTNLSINERMEPLIPASKIANQNAGELVALVAKKNSRELENYNPNIFKGRIALNMQKIENEKHFYTDLPNYYNFGSPERKQITLLNNMKKIIEETEQLFTDD